MPPDIAAFLQNDPALPLVVIVWPGPGRTGWFARSLGPGLRWAFFGTTPCFALERTITTPYLPRIRGGFLAALYAVRHRARLVVSHDPRVSFACQFFLHKLGFRGKHLAFSFNFPCLPSGLKHRLMADAFRDIDRFLVYSQVERTLYHRSFGIPLNKIDFRHWAVAPPTVENPHRPLIDADCICAMGENSRDYPTLMAAIATLPHIRLVLVARPHNLVGLHFPPNVQVLTNIPLARAMNILKFSRFMVLPLAGGQVPCGHVTIVSAMHLGKAFVATDSAGIHDYATHEHNALLCEPHSPTAMAAAIARLYDDPDLCAQLGANGARFAAACCCEQSMFDYFRGYLLELGLLR